MLKHAATPVPTPAPSDLVGDLVGPILVPIIVLVISLGYSSYLADRQRRHESAAFAAQRDFQYADTFLAEVRDITGWRIAGTEPGLSRVLMSKFNQSYSRFLELASGGASDRLGGYLSDLNREMWEVQGELIETMNDITDNGRYPFPDPTLMFLPETVHRFDTAADEIRATVRAWPYPEKRRALILKTLEAGPMHDGVWAPGERELQIDRWMLTAWPEEGWWMRRWRHLSVWIRSLMLDFRYGRLGYRVFYFFYGLRVHRSEMRAIRPQIREEKRRAREEAELWKLRIWADEFRRRGGSVDDPIGMRRPL